MPSAIVDRVHIGRFRATYRVAANHPNGEDVRRRLDGVLAGPLTRALRATLARPLPVEDGVWLIDRIVLDLQVDVDCAPDVVARHWARHVAQGLVRAVHAGEGVVYFPDRTRFLAAFLLDLVEGEAWRRWYWRPFHGLKALPVAAALRTAVLDDPDRGLRALLAIEDGRRQRLLAALSDGEARRLLDGLSAVPESGFGIERALTLALAEGDWGVAADRPAIAALALYLGVAGLAPELAGPSLATLARAISALAAVRLRRAPATLAGVADALRRADRAAVARLAGAGDGAALLPLLALATPARRVAAAWLVGDGAAPVAAPPPSDGTDATEAVPRYTRFGGALILLPLLDRLPIGEATVAWPGLNGTPAMALVRLLVLAKCVGVPNALALILDPLIRALFGLPPRPTPRTIGDWTATITPRHWRALQRAIVQAEPSPGTSSRFAWHATVRGGVGVVLAGEDHWLLCAPARPVPSRRWFQGVAIAHPPPAAADGAREKVARDLAWLTLPPLLCRSRSADTTLSLAARAVLRAAATRLPGFAESSAPYLWRNFLDVPGRLLDDGEERRVTLGRPPIQVVLNQSGLARARFTLSWLDERPFVLGGEG